MPYTKILKQIKQQIISAFNNEKDYIDVARILEVKRITAYGIVRRNQEYGVVVRPRGGARVIKVDEEMRNCLTEIVENNPAFTLKQV